jgi:gamma-glutamyltranspeptidase/glutathione hydrolase
MFFSGGPQLFLLGICLAALAACGALGGGGTATPGSATPTGFAGAVAADEPKAAEIARDVLASGGTAADAAVAGYFALAVTMPSTAGLGGGGTCLINDRPDKTVEAIMFLPLAGSGGQIVPLNVRGMALLQARHGTAHWSALLGPAQRLAQQGMPVSRALARELATAAAKLSADPNLAQIFLGADGQPLHEGDTLTQPDLASLLSQIRAGGPGSFYGGQAAARLLDSAQTAGLPLTSQDLQGALPTLDQPLIVDLGGPNLYFTPPSASGGLETAELLGLLTQTRSWGNADAGERPHLFAEASMRTFADRSHWLKPDGSSATAPDQILDGSHLSDLMASYASDKATPAASLNPPPLPAHAENPWAASIVTADKDGNAVACNFTLNDLFGSGHMLPGTGVVLAAAPNQTGQDPFNLGAMIYTSRAGGSFFYAAAASGGVTAPTALAQVFLAAANDKQPLETAIAAHRIHHNGSPDVVFYEPGTDPALLQDLTQHGHQLQQASILGRVQAIWCPSSSKNQDVGCQAAADPRGDGEALVLRPVSQ